MREQIKEAHWVLKKIIPGVIKITPSGCGVRQLAFIKAFYIEAMYFDYHNSIVLHITEAFQALFSHIIILIIFCIATIRS